MTTHHGDCLDVMADMPDNSVHAIVTDPPYGLGFMGKDWDDLPPGLPWAQECLRILKPGGHLLAFGGTRTWHRLAVAIEDAGFEMRDSIAWLYGSGFPKSRNVGKEVPALEGWGTALKPAFEPIVVARKPLSGTVAANVLAHGTGALNIDGTRVPGAVPSVPQPDFRHVNGVTTHLDAHARNGEMSSAPGGRWPTNVVLDSDMAAELDQQSGFRRPGERPAAKGITSTPGQNGTMGGGWTGSQQEVREVLDAGGGASRFFPVFRYQAKAPASERPTVTTEDGTKTAHPTVKPLDLMRWLVRLVTPPGGTVLDPFAGSGATIEACILEHFDWIAIERDADYLPLIGQRITRSTTPTPAPIKRAPVTAVIDALTLFDTEEPA